MLDTELINPNETDIGFIFDLFKIEYMYEAFNKIGLTDLKYGEVPYSELCKDLCNNACYAFLTFLSKTFEGLADLDKDFKIQEGNFSFMGNHTWIIIDDRYILDLTLTQFVPDAPEISLFKIKSEEYGEHGYCAVREYTANDWLDKINREK